MSQLATTPQSLSSPQPQAPPATWSTRNQIKDHTLSLSIINLHTTSGNYVFDPTQLALLQKFAVNPSVELRDQMAVENGWVDEQGRSLAGEKGSLVGLIVEGYGRETPEDIFDEKDWQLVKEWFGGGMKVGTNVTR